MRRREFLRTWEMVAKVPFFQSLGATLIAEVARLLRVRDYPAAAVIFRRGEPGDCMYFVVEGEVEVMLDPKPLRFGADYFFGELALLTGAPRNATIMTTRPCTLRGPRHRRFLRAAGPPAGARPGQPRAEAKPAPGTGNPGARRVVGDDRARKRPRLVNI